MGINYIILGLFLINVISVFCESDCDKLNSYLKGKGINVECCGKSHYVLCKGNDIKSM